jgi:hypothetical protein
VILAASLSGLAGADEGASGLLNVSPPILFFFLGVVAILVRSRLALPKAVTKLLALYLLWAIGYRGGVELATSGLNSTVLATIVVAVGLSVLGPLWCYLALRRLVSRGDAAALAACYGSVSVVTFLTACTVLDQSGTAFSGHMVAVMAMMEFPAIVAGLLLLRLDERLSGGPTAAAATDGTPVRRQSLPALLHESLLNGPILLLLGSIVVGLLTGERGYAAFKPLCTDAFNGVLAFFLLDLGLVAARRFRHLVTAPKVLLVFALVAPLVNAGLAIAAAKAFGIGAGDATLLAVLASSASYIAAPAALRLAIPQANPALYVSLALGVTFPFNIVVGIPLYAWAARAW